jgi:hypothetical protein
MRVVVESGVHCVTIVGIVDQATTCIMSLAVTPGLPATCATGDLFRGSFRLTYERFNPI